MKFNERCRYLSGHVNFIQTNLKCTNLVKGVITLWCEEHLKNSKISFEDLVNVSITEV